MAKPFETYQPLIVESYKAVRTSGLHGNIHIRPIEGQGIETNLRVECDKKMTDTKIYPLGTRFRIRAKLTDRKGKGMFLYTYFGWKFEVLSRGIN